MQTRRNFIGNVATGLAGSLATGRVLGANNRIRFGLIGAGNRGIQIAREAVACPETEFAAVADIYNRRFQDAARLAPAARTFIDLREMLDDRTIDAVLIATPQHLHADGFTAAVHSGKHVYIQQAMALTVDQAKAMRTALRKAGRRTIQIGHQSCSSGHVADATNYLASGALGQVTAIRARMYRNAPPGKPQWTRPVYPDMTAEYIGWKAFLGTAAEREYDANRYINWRLFADYSGGNVHENMSQQISFWYKVMGLRIPGAVTMTGGLYRWKDGREVPDTMNVVMAHDHRDEQLLFSWDSGFGNSEPGVGEDVPGSDGTISRDRQIRYLPQKVARPDGVEMLGRTPTPPHAHMRNFFDSIRGGRETSCPFEAGYRVSITCAMAIESYAQGRTVRWDAAKEEIA